jgi:hypothetical protein
VGNHREGVHEGAKLGQVSRRLAVILKKKNIQPRVLSVLEDMDGASETAELAAVKNDVNDLDARGGGCLEENATAH